MYDMQAKEHVLITNGICRLDHSNQEAFAKSHANGIGSCEMVPHEAIALRVFPEANGKHVIAWTYRGVDHTQLRECEQSAKGMFDVVLGHKRSNRFIGRI